VQCNSRKTQQQTKQRKNNQKQQQLNVHSERKRPKKMMTITRREEKGPSKFLLIRYTYLFEFFWENVLKIMKNSFSLIKPE